MPRTVAIALLALVLSSPTLGFQRGRKGRAMRNHRPVIQSFTSSNSTVTFCPFFPQGPCGHAVVLTVAATDPNNDELTYQYSVSNGDIEGAGSMVTWNLNKFGTQKAKVDVSDPKGARSSRTVQDRKSVV